MSDNMSQWGTPKNAVDQYGVPTTPLFFQWLTAGTYVWSVPPGISKIEMTIVHDGKAETKLIDVEHGQKFIIEIAPGGYSSVVAKDGSWVDEWRKSVGRWLGVC